MIIAAGLVVQLRMMVQRVLLRRMAMKHSLHMFISAIGYIATLFADFWGVVHWVKFGPWACSMLDHIGELC